MTFYDNDGHVIVADGIKDVAEFHYEDKGDYVFIHDLDCFDESARPFILYAIAGEYRDRVVRFVVDADDDLQFARLCQIYGKAGAKLEGLIMSYGGNG